MACSGDVIDCVAGESGAGSMGGSVASSAGDAVAVSRVITEREGGCRHSCNLFRDDAVVKAMPLFGSSTGSATSLGGMNKICSVLSTAGERSVPGRNG